jgi:cyclophilin family peptidyl-prolyl cis-trans isomerase/HEAT repeat protein
MRRALVLLPCLLAACATPLGENAPPASQVAIEAREEFVAIARLEDLRSDDGGTLSAFLSESDAKVRARAALALGRLPRAEGDEAIRISLEQAATADPDSDVRRMALFALGQRADPQSGEAIVALLGDQDAGVRARAVEALAKLLRPDLRGPVLAALDDAAAEVRLEAAHGPHRWLRTEADAEEVDARVAALLERENDPQVVMYALSTLERRHARAGRAAFERYATSPIPKVRLFAVRGLKSLAPADGLVEPLRRAMDDKDWRVVVEAAMGLGLCDSPEADQVLGAATKALSPHVRRTAWEALAGRVDRITTQPEARALHQSLRPFWLDRETFDGESSLSVQAAFLELELPLLARLRSLGAGWTQAQSTEIVAKLDEVGRRQPPVVLVGLAHALGRIPEDFSREALASLAAHADPLVAGAAIEALGKHPGEWTRTLLLSLLENRDNGLRLAALLSLAEMAVAGDMPALVQLYRTSRGEIGPEVRFNCVRVAQKISPQAPSPVAELALNDEDAFVRAVARQVYRSLDAPVPQFEPAAAAAQATVPVPGVDFPTYTRNPQVEVRTTRGPMVFELFPAEAPVHVHNFLELAKRGVYDGLTFHRVVQDFVVQGGDPRGDGNGGTSWRGGSLRQEIGPRKYVRGSLGMPRNEDPDSGGGQLFVTHRPTPHLDGRYTIFGELVAGGPVLDAIEVGDKILSVRVQ